MAKRKRTSTQNRKVAHPKHTEQPQEPLSQEESPLFRLPPEIRLIIYKYIFVAPTTIHLSWVHGCYCRFRSFLCKLPEEHQYEKTRSGDLCDKCREDHFKCHPRQKPPNKNAIKRRTYIPPRQRQTRVMNMLRSCKRVYYETIDMLYQQNSFYIEHPYTLTELCKYMPKERLSSFRTLSLEFLPENRSVYLSRYEFLPLPGWSVITRALKKLDGLEFLCLIMRPYQDQGNEIQAIEKLIQKAKAQKFFAVAPRLLWAATSDIWGTRKKSVRGCPLHGIHGTESQCSRYYGF